MNSILIIGGNSDIGYATAKTFAKNKYDIHLASRNIEELNIKKDEIIKLYKVKCKITHLDLFQDDKVNFFFEENIESPDVILIACGFLQTEEKDFDKIVCANYLSPLKFIEKSIKRYQSQKILKTIIGISSVAGDRGKKKNSIYSSAKSGFSSYLDGLRQKLNTAKIHVITVKPGWVDTKMTKELNLPKFMTSNVNYIGNKIFKAHESKKCILYVPGYWSLIMFIYKMVPEFIFKIFAK
jgi:decaprenylphospho-beta-D-erythro-pentofuranosid-2-ulose 2-reductase